MRATGDRWQRRYEARMPDSLGCRDVRWLPGTAWNGRHENVVVVFGKLSILCFTADLLLEESSESSNDDCQTKHALVNSEVPTPLC